MKVSLITTIFNEEKTIQQFIDSIENQTLPPNEVVVVEAGSTDNTLPKLKTLIKELGPAGKKYRLSVSKNANRSKGRNTAIGKAKNELIAATDAGCLLKEDWLWEITKNFKNRHTMAVAGYYLPSITTIFQKCLSPFVCIMPGQLKPGFLPSSRSIAFRKSIWLKVGGYPEDLNYCEDLVFDKKVVKAGYKFELAGQAIVYWPQRKNIFQAFKQFYNYAYGDGQVLFSTYQTHTVRIISLYLRYLLFLAFIPFIFIEPRSLPFLVGVYLLYLGIPLISKYKYIKDLRAVIIVPLIKFIADIAVIAGSLAGIIRGR